MLRADTVIYETAASMPRVQPVEGVRTRIDIAFTNKAGIEKKAIRKDAEKMLKKLAPALQRLLTQDEFVVYLAGACAPMSGVEQWTFGYFAQFVSRVVLVFTNQRLLAFRVNHNGDWRKSLRGCALGDVQSAKLSGWLVRYLKLQYANGKKESYWALKLRDKAKLAAMLPKLLEASAGAQTHAQAMQPLCPACAAVLVERQYECRACGQKFRSEDSLWWRSFIPGGGYFYAKQNGMGVLHAIFDTFITIDFLMVIFAAFAAKSKDKTQDFWIGVAFITFILLFERLVALWHARRFVREFIPIDAA
jgi:predicted RNA-binding Zn-ribbon protein involved in translation (DUF1610 family)